MSSKTLQPSQVTLGFWIEFDWMLFWDMFGPLLWFLRIERIQNKATELVLSIAWICRSGAFKQRLILFEIFEGGINPKELGFKC